MAAVRTPRQKPAATLRIVASTELAAPQNDWSGRVAALSALARSEPLQRAVRFLSYGLLVALIGVVLLVATATVPVVFGYHTYRVEGGSMAPSLEAGSVAVTKPTSPRALQVGDIIAWQSSTERRPVLHRIVQITNVDGQRRFVTQGDQNRTADPQPVALQGPGDKVIYSVPYAGYILGFARSGLGRALLIGVPLALLAAIFLRDMRRTPQLRRGAGAETAADIGAREATTSRGIIILKSRAENYADLPVFLLEQLRQLSERRTDSQRQREERLAA